MVAEPGGREGGTVRMKSGRLHVLSVLLVDAWAGREEGREEGKKGVRAHMAGASRKPIARGGREGGREGRYR